jgi:membrane-associated phospholipid phosphatase
MTNRDAHGRKLAAIVAAALTIALSACGAGVSPAGTRGEPTAGNWKTWVLASPGQITVPAPPSRAATDRETAELRRVAGSRTPAAERMARAWNGQAAIQRWMDVNFDLVAARAKDPPAASRAYGLLSVAMYDAVVATWHEKYRYRRSAPRAVGALFAPGPDPSYPSEHAAIAGAASRVLAYLYPERPAARLDAMADEAARSRVVAGVSYPSDARAGLALGRGVADAVIAYAKRDGSDRRWDGTRPHGDGAWEPPPGSLARPVSPMAGSWRTWVMQSGRQFRAPPFPPYGSAAYRAEARAVLDAKTNLTPDQRRIARFWAGGQGTALPPGIWNQVVLAYMRRSPLSIPRMARVLALLNVAQADAGVASWDTKFAYWVTRPVNAIRGLGLDRHWKPYLDTPFFPAYVSGHATYSGAAGEVLAHLFPEDAPLWHAKAKEAAISRVYGGIHYPLDGTVGLRMGVDIGRLVVAHARADGAER